MCTRGKTVQTKCCGTRLVSDSWNSLFLHGDSADRNLRDKKRQEASTNVDGSSAGQYDRWQKYR